MASKNFAGFLLLIYLGLLFCPAGVWAQLGHAYPTQKTQNFPHPITPQPWHYAFIEGAGKILGGLGRFWMLPGWTG